MPGVTKEQIEQAKKWDLLSYLQAYEPGELVKKHGEYRTKSHDSLVISNGKWCWNSAGIGGKTALDYLIKVRGLDFVEAVETLCGERSAAQWAFPPPIPKQEPPKPFALPEASQCGAAMVSYLQDRGIDPDIISQCIGAGILYESRRYQNCVFVGKDLEGKARFASLRGTHDGFRMDVEGSNKQYSFVLPAADPKSRFLAVTESPIDALSLATVLKMQGDDPARYHFLSLGGTAPRALLQFLHDHPTVDHISLCLDNDKAGLTGMGKIRQAMRDDPALSPRVMRIADNPPPIGYGKDYNEFLKARIAVLHPERMRSATHSALSNTRS